MSKHSFFSTISALLVATLLFTNCTKEAPTVETVNETIQDEKVNAQAIDRDYAYKTLFGQETTANNRGGNFLSETNLVLNLKGTATGYDGSVPDNEGTGIVAGNCFEAALIYVPTGKVIGTGVDCLSKVRETGGGLALLGTAIFDFGPFGTLTTQGLTSVQPKTHGSEHITHITGAIPSPGENSIIGGTGIFEGATGTSRLSGAVNMGNIHNNEITFDCLFVIDFD